MDTSTKSTAQTISYASKATTGLDAPPPWRGCIDRLEDGVIGGWAMICKKGEIDALLEISVLGVDLGVFRTNEHRPDVASEFDKNGFGFRYDLRSALEPKREEIEEKLKAIKRSSLKISELLRIKFSESEYLLPMSGRLSSKSMTIAQISQLMQGNRKNQPDQADSKEKPAAKAPPREYKVRLERLSETSFSGWAVNTASKDEIFELELFVNGAWFCKLRNDGTRDDLKRADLSNGLGGIVQALPIGLLENGEATIGLRLPDGTQIDQKFSVSISSAPVAAPTPRLASRVSVIVPIYNAVEDTQVCIERLIAHTTTDCRVILINDASPDAAVAKLLKRYAQVPNFKILTNKENMGFTRTVNRGIVEAGTDDVVFLNSDARVTSRWLEGLRSAVASDPLIGTATPLSDRAGAFSAPRIGNNNRLPFGVEEDEHAIAVRRHSLRLYPTVPTGNGFCMYVRRPCLDEVGLLDEKAFPRGYGEENDFCMRARALGWRNIIDDATYVFHERSKSFGEQKTDLMAAGRKAVDARHPDYSYSIKVFGESGQIALARYRVGQARTMLERGQVLLPRILFVASTVTGGTPQTNRDLMSSLSDTWEPWLLRCNSRVMSLSRVTKRSLDVVETHSLQEPVSPTSHRSFEYDRVLAGWLAKYDFDLVHIRQLVWHSLSLPRLAKEAGAAVINSFHDFYTISPSVKLLDEDNIFCGAQPPEGKSYGRSELWPVNSMPDLNADWIRVWQNQFADALKYCDAYVTTSPSARSMILDTLPPEAAERFAVIPHGRDFSDMRQNIRWPNAEDTVRILVPGNISIAKGRKLIEDLLDRDQTDRRLEFHILGDHDFPGPRRGLHFHGKYVREEFNNHVSRIAPHVGAVFSIWDETYCHTLTEMWAAGLPVIGLDYPTVAGRIRASNGGWVYSESDVDKLYADIARDMKDGDGFMERLRAVIEWQSGEGRSNTTRVMASKYHALYHEVAKDRLRLRTPEMRLPNVHKAGQSRVAVVCPADAAQESAPGSTHIRVWARTQNHANRKVTFVRMSPKELLAAVRCGDIDKAIVQRNAIPGPIWQSLKSFVEAGKLRYALDIDDDLLSVPADKDPDGSYALYAPVLTDILAHATLVIASTEVLARRLKDKSKQIKVLPNLLSGAIWRGRLPRRRNENIVRGLYMGNRSHDADFAMVKSSFDAMARSTPNLRLRLVGALQEPLSNVPDWLEVVDIPLAARGYPAFVGWLRDQCDELDFGIAPLVKGQFNECKSYLKILDYAGLGLPVLASNHPVYTPLAGNDHVTLVDNTAAAWETALKGMLRAGKPSEARRAAIRDWISANHQLESTLEQYDDLLLESLGGAA